MATVTTEKEPPATERSPQPQPSGGSDGGPGAESPIAISAQHVYAYYGARRAVTDISMEIRRN